MFDHASASTATEIVQNSAFERFARTGYVVSGLSPFPHFSNPFRLPRLVWSAGVGGVGDIEEVEHEGL